jgi:hypothetical protein
MEADAAAAEKAHEEAEKAAAVAARREREEARDGGGGATDGGDRPLAAAAAAAARAHLAARVARLRREVDVDGDRSDAGRALSEAADYLERRGERGRAT